MKFKKKKLKNQKEIKKMENKIEKDWVIVTDSGNVVEVLIGYTDEDADIAFSEFERTTDYDEDLELIEKEEWEVV